MKVCSCRDFDEAAMGTAIRDKRPAHPEQVHEIIRNEPPQCGACLCSIQAAMDQYERNGKIPRIIDLTDAQLREAREKLKARFSGAVDGADPATPPANRPAFKRRYAPDPPPPAKAG